MTSPTLVAQTTNYKNANSTSDTVTLPAYTYGSDIILLFVSRNQGTTPTASGSVTLTTLADCGPGRGVIFQVVPDNGSVTSFTLNFSNSLIRWACFSFSNVNQAYIAKQAGANGTNTSSQIPIPDTTLTYTADGTELALAMACINASATWTTDANTLFYNTSTAESVAMMIEKVTPTIGVSKITFSSLDRGNNGVNKNESSAVVVLTSGPTNYLVSGGFEEGSTLATGWTEEHTTGSPATYSLSTTTGLQQGAKAQRMQFSGGTGVPDKVEFYQAVDNVFIATNSCTFSVYLSGSITNAYYQIVIEAHHIGTGYISEVNLPILSLTGTPTLYSVTFNNLPATTDRVVCVISANELTSATVDLYADQSTLIAAVGGLPFFMQYDLLAGGLQTLSGGFQ